MCPEARHASAMRASCSNRCRVSSAAQWATGATRTASASIAFQSITHPRRVTVAPSQRAPTGWRSSVLSACADNARSPQNTSHCKSASMCRRKCTLRTCAPRCTPTLFHRWSSFPSPPLGHSSINPGGGGWRRKEPHHKHDGRDECCKAAARHERPSYCVKYPQSRKLSLDSLPFIPSSISPRTSRELPAQVLPSSPSRTPAG